MIRALVVVALVAACNHGSSPAPQPSPAPPPAPQPPPAPAPSAEPGMITDEQCLAQGGRIVDEHTYEHLNRRPPGPDDPEPRPFRICKIPSPMNGKACADDGDCQGGRCFCDGPLARPNPSDDPALRALDGKPATGRCSDEPIESGTWRCLVVGGKAQLAGIIVD